MSNSTAPKAAATPIGNLPSHVSSLYHQTFDWLIVNWFEALIAVGIGILLFLALHFAKSLGNRLCRRDTTGKGWYTVFGRAIARTGNFFMYSSHVWRMRRRPGIGGSQSGSCRRGFDFAAAFAFAAAFVRAAITPPFRTSGASARVRARAGGARRSSR